MIHSALRWAVLAAAGVGLLHTLWLRSSPPVSPRAMATVFVSLVDVQAVLGVILLFGAGALASTWRHVLFMALTLFLVHLLHRRVRRHRSSESRRPRLALYGIPLVLMGLGLIQVI
jgi:heme A synthase